ncbi:phosphoribosylformylglycinamidine synthase [Acetivibrio thermocellus AD2]|jgi:phosphoribosylformylglycinamidine synthase|uniref:Phosphoribosylformylglycinamidine synthase n=1 Tax=Acetivibrio thermocellus AD2 TaxID=1138384 RepID=A0AB36TGK4_ACETH|nr:phosphoribosylformylglycinamidine synthase [Acetivibrio thermocellus]CDG35247.1 phosphoribosylformylglycinamidine synthase [Acetivibrio thermocellus BC1]ADU74740.1 phosphoribosylformylglycinamidine synthase [Acetivibrio thermocellus DSM 1313]ALX08691.1 phosphoribosylformylglycinamidine synthase [Acetivibrio thermocellus AD2]ANV76443.1 phosphoribosylformylglycinamidine synthase [Acetivibrio thermocellus DSM 2360]EIC05333.1 phosphoribosylformylglycinamidine synthase [Acetivibrio thermocellus 
MVRRVFVEKKKGFDLEAQRMYRDLKENLRIAGLSGVRLINRYDVEGISDEEYESAKRTIFSEPPVEEVFDETISIDEKDKIVAIEYLPGQYDQRADSASQCIQILTHGERPNVKVAKLIVLQGDVSQEEYEKVKKYLINPVECQEASLEKPSTLDVEVTVPEDVKVLKGFVNMSREELKAFADSMGLAMSLEDLEFCQKYFRDDEKRDPTITEIRVIDTYWSDHCRHTTFLTRIQNVDIQEGRFTAPVKEAYESYLQSRKFVYGDKEKDVCLMDIAVMGMRELKKRGLLNDLDESDEVNACSIVVNVDVNGKNEEWLVMFKNETHNHPTEIEPFGGAATCLGGAIRDPLSGRSYVYQAMRVTGSGDPRTSIDDTLPGKLPQRKITTEAAQGYSSYGNQIGLATGQVAEIYDEDFVAKRMEIGAVIGAAPRKNVKREKPKAGDVIILLGGRTGRDGCGGATGSSKEHTEESLLTCGAEVQKGNPITERKIQRLFRKPEVSTMIKKCNDFGAGGVSVAIGELAEGLRINLDAVPKKYEGLDGTELAISESQERMAVMVAKENVDAFIKASKEENLEATPVAEVTDDRRLVMYWRGKAIVDIKRDFLDTNGVKQNTNVLVAAPLEEEYYFAGIPKEAEDYSKDLRDAWIRNLQRLNVCSQKGLVERFDSTIGAGTVLMPFGGKYQLTPSEGMAAKIPVPDGDTNTGTLMAFGYNPSIAKWSPFHGAMFAVIESVAKIVAMGGNHKKIRLSLQEYFEKLGKDPKKWGKPFSALLGAYYAQTKIGIPAIGGKDSMSGTFKDMNVPPTLVSFAVATMDVNYTVSSEFKKAGSKVVLIPLKINENGVPDFAQLDKNYAAVHQMIMNRKVLAAHTVRSGGISEAISKMCFGNMIGFKFEASVDARRLFEPLYGSIVLELDESLNLDELLKDVEYEFLGVTQEKTTIDFGNVGLDLVELCQKWQEPLEKVFPTATEPVSSTPKQYKFEKRNSIKPSVSIAKPRIFMPIFPGTNCEYDTARAFEKAGGVVDMLVIKNLTPSEIDESIREMAKRIDNSQIVMIPGGFSGGDEPDGSGKFIATAFRNPRVKDAVMRLLKERDGLMLGICNGFQALIKLGLVPYGEIRDLNEDSPTLTFNTIGRHVSCMVRTKITSTLSPWFNNVKVGDIHTIAVSHGEGRFVASKEVLEMMEKNGQIATQYVDLDGNATYDIRFNPNGSFEAIEGITSPDGRVLGKMGHSERIGTNVAKNVPGDKDQKLFEAGVNYFK